MTKFDKILLGNQLYQVAIKTNVSRAISVLIISSLFFFFKPPDTTDCPRRFYREIHFLGRNPCRCNYAMSPGSHCSSSGMSADVAGIPTGPAGPHGPPPVGPPGPHTHPHPGSVAAAQLEAAERLALATDPMVRLQMAGISPEYHAHTHAHTHAHSHTHLHLHPSQQAQQAQAQQEAAAAASGTAGFPLPGELVSCLGLAHAGSVSMCSVITFNQLHALSSSVLLLVRDLIAPSFMSELDCVF
jgi:hypothetical protein